MSQFELKMDTDSAPILDRIMEAYGFESKMMLARHFDMAASSISARYKRGGFPADLVVQCIAETGATLEWLATGNGEKFDNSRSSDLDVLNLNHYKLEKGELHHIGYVLVDKATFTAEAMPTPKAICIIEDNHRYIVEPTATEMTNGEWLVNIERQVGVRLLTRIPVNKVRVSGGAVEFDCQLSDIEVLGRVILKAELLPVP